MKRIAALFLFFSAAALLIGCAPPRPQPYAFPPVDPQAWLDQWRAGLSQPAVVLRGEAKIRIEENNRPFHGELRALFDGADRLYVEVSGFGFAGLWAAAEQGRVQVYDLRERVVYDSGPNAQSDPPFPFLGLRLTLRQLQRALQGLPALPAERYIFKATAPEVGGYRLAGTSPEGGAAEVIVIPHLGRLARESWRQGDGKILLCTDFPTYWTVGGRLLPKKIEWRLPGRNLSLRLTWKTLEPAAALPEDAFRLALPPDVQRRPLH